MFPIFKNEDNDGLTNSGYARIVKKWTRGTPLDEAKLVFEVDQAHVGGLGRRELWFDGDDSFSVDYIKDDATFFTGDYYIIDKHSENLTKLMIPEDAEVSFYWDTLLVKLNKPWNNGHGEFVSGSLLRATLQDVIDESRKGEERGNVEMVNLFQLLFEPSPTISLKGYQCTKNYVILNLLDNLKPSLIKWRKYASGKWEKVNVFEMQ